MAVTISIELSDAEYAVAQAAFAADDGDGNAVTIDAAYLKQSWLVCLHPVSVTTMMQGHQYRIRVSLLANHDRHTAITKRDV